eukprot:TRINITY_DN12861_c0_g1_i1.p1 TRINITY_DN12861_c0_g1~~TRINITY_DN12861_c0_g1_i1.p1  ORF type:complete len:141 (+),score=27.59 TRINITY_DN12861_c0_g1_i1:1-423(+)
MAAGAIPVIVVNHYVLPYQDLLDWKTFSVQVPEHRMLELPEILARITPEEREIMQRNVVFVYEQFFSSLSHQVHTALESARVNLFMGDKQWYSRRKVQLDGFNYRLPAEWTKTPDVVLQDSLRCNTPPFRRKGAQDNAPM